MTIVDTVLCRCCANPKWHELGTVLIVLTNFIKEAQAFMRKQAAGRSYDGCQIVTRKCMEKITRRIVLVQSHESYRLLYIYAAGICDRLKQITPLINGYHSTRA